MNHLHKFHEEVMESSIGLTVLEKFGSVLTEKGFKLNTANDKALAKKNIKIILDMKNAGIYKALNTTKHDLFKLPATGEMTELVELMNSYKKQYRNSTLDHKVSEAAINYPKASESPNGLTPAEVKKCLAAAFSPNAERLSEAELKKISYPEQKGDNVRNVPGWMPLALLDAYRLRNLRPTWDKMDIRRFESAADRTFKALIQTFEDLARSEPTSGLATPPSLSDEDDKG